jgi:hypothetical protein
MIAIADLAYSLNGYFEAQRQLEACRQRATGDVEYYAYSYIREFEHAEAALTQALDAYVDQRIQAHLALPALLPPSRLPAGVPTAP